LIFDFSDEQKMLSEQLQRFLAEFGGGDRLRALIDRGDEWDQALWKRFADAGFLGAAIPPEFGGTGLSQLDLAAISHEIGRATAPIPFFSSIILAAQALLCAGSPSQQRQWLPRLASGETVATLAYPSSPWGSAGMIPTVQLDNGRLTGTCTPVADAGIANLALVAAIAPDGVCLVLIELDSPGVSRTRLNAFDELRPHHMLRFDGARAERLPGDAPTALAEIFDRAAVQTAFEAIGGAEAALLMARDYVMERIIFGRRLASYQAIKHKLADIYVAIELARASAFDAALSAETGDDLAIAAAVARLKAADAFELAARENLHVHGGFGYTFEADCHFYYRRERTLAVNLGGRLPWAERLLATVIRREDRHAA
jgi:acyl-CoA dehydrogenase